MENAFESALSPPLPYRSKSETASLCAETCISSYCLLKSFPLSAFNFDKRLNFR